MRGNISTNRASAPSPPTRPGRQAPAACRSAARAIGLPTGSSLLQQGRTASGGSRCRTAVRARLAACGRTDSAATTIRFWTIGREGEVVAQLLPEFERAHPGVRIEIQQIPLTAAHEKLLTAFAGDALAGHLPARQYLDSRIRRARRTRTVAAVRRCIDGRAQRRLLSRHLGHQRRSMASLYGVPWYVDTRLLFYRTDLLAKAGFDHAPRDWDEWRRAMAAIKAQGGSGQIRDLPAAQRVRAAARPGAAAARSAAARQRHARQLRKRRIPPRAGVLRRDVPQRLGAADEQHADLQRLGRIRARLLYVLHHRTLEHRRIQAPRAADRRPVEHGAAAGIRGPWRRRGRRFELRDLPQFDAQADRLGTRRVSVRGRAAAEILRTDRRSAAAAQRLELSGAGAAMSMRTRSTSNSSTSRRRRRCRSGSASPRRCA